MTAYIFLRRGTAQCTHHNAGDDKCVRHACVALPSVLCAAEKAQMLVGRALIKEERKERFKSRFQARWELLDKARRG